LILDVLLVSHLKYCRLSPLIWADYEKLTDYFHLLLNVSRLQG